MGKQTIIESIKEWLAGICWHLFLWLNNLTEDEYFRQIKEQELRTDDSRPLEKLVMPKIAGKVDNDTFKKIAEYVELEINEKHSHYWSNIAMGNASARFWHAYKKYIDSNFSE